MSVTAAAALQLVDVHKSFGPTPIIRGVSLDVVQGERHAIIGPNGAGKSTLFHIISGRFPPSRGAVRLNGTDITGKRPYEINRRGLSRSFQVIFLNPAFMFAAESPFTCLDPFLTKTHRL